MNADDLFYVSLAKVKPLDTNGILDGLERANDTLSREIIEMLDVNIDDKGNLNKDLGFDPPDDLVPIMAIEQAQEIIKRFKRKPFANSMARSSGQYTKEECEKIHDWYTKACDAPDFGDPNDWIEYKHGQLLEGVGRIDSLYDWDRWQHLQNMMGMVLSLDMASKIGTMLWENDVEILEMETEKSKETGR